MSLPRRERVVALTTAPIMAYHDEPVREMFWRRLREGCAYIANRDQPGWTLDENDNGERMVQFARFVPSGVCSDYDGDEEEMVLFPCPEEEAEMVYMRLVCWAVEPLQETSPEG